MKLTGWGKSMYGGWYINFYKDGIHDGRRFRTLSELRQFAKDNDVILSNVWRLDN